MESLVGKTGDALLSWGPPGIAVLVLLAAVVFLFRELRSCERCRIADNREMVEALKTAAQTAAAVKEAIDSATRAHNDSAQFRQEMTMAIKGFEKTIESLEKTIEGAVARNVQLHQDHHRLILERVQRGGSQ